MSGARLLLEAAIHIAQGQLLICRAIRALRNCDRSGLQAVADALRTLIHILQKQSKTVSD